MTKCGYVGVIGKTNAGKSTLVNTLVGEKVAIVTPKTQTTRSNILGIFTENDAQIIFVDTPGIHKSRNQLDKAMMKSVRGAISYVDIILFVIDGTRKLDVSEMEYIKKLSEKPIIVGVSKTDIAKKENVIQILTHLGAIDNILSIIPFSSNENNNIDVLKKEIIKVLPNRNFEYDSDMYTDSTVRFMSEEIIREKAMMALREELPHGVKVEITNFDETNNKVTYIDADLICEKDSHKGIVLGKNGENIKKIASEARLDIENLLNKKIMLKIWVKVIKNWRQNQNNMV
ncbi:MAG: GTPase Era [Clostridia bacterium]|nr:GTPase Era [Clostridia bacterium]